MAWKIWTSCPTSTERIWVIWISSTCSGPTATPLRSSSISYRSHYSRRRNAVLTSHYQRLIRPSFQEKYGYSCDELFRECQLAGKVMNCCSDLFERQVVMRRGICFQTRKFVNQVSKALNSAVVVDLLYFLVYFYLFLFSEKKGWQAWSYHSDLRFMPS